jgi:hypothetical protein
LGRGARFDLAGPEKVHAIRPHIFTTPMQANDTDFRRLAKRGYKRLLVALLSARRAELG